MPNELRNWFTGPTGQTCSPAAANEDQRDPAIIFTSGRSGSTLLLRMMNCLPRTVMWGEHGGVLTPLLQSYSRSRAVAASANVDMSAAHLPAVLNRLPVLRCENVMSLEWLNWFTESDIDSIYRDFVTSMFYPDHIRGKFSRWGFKEIRYKEPEYTALRKLFPGMRAIILYRNPVDVCASQFENFAKFDNDKCRVVLKRLEIFYQFASRQAQQPNHDGLVFVSYEDLTRDFDRTASRLEHFLGESFSRQVKAIRREVRQSVQQQELTGRALPEDCLERFDKWTEERGLQVSRQGFQQIAEHYSVLKQLQQFV